MKQDEVAVTADGGSAPADRIGPVVLAPEGAEHPLGAQAVRGRLGRPRSNGGSGSGLSLLIAAVLGLGLLHLASLRYPSQVVPDLPSIARATWEILTNEYSDILVTLVRFLVALLAAMAGGWTIGLAMASQRQVGQIGDAIMRILLATPALSLILVVVLWLRDVEMRVFAVTFLIAVPFYVIAVYEGVKSIDHEMIEAVRQFRPSRWQVFTYVLAPHSVVNVLMSTKQVAGFVLRMVVFAELLAATTGVGSAMLQAQSAFRMDLIFGWTVVLIVFNFALMGGLERLERVLLKWRPANAVG